jgi:hypothetical protein
LSNVDVSAKDGKVFAGGGVTHVEPNWVIDMSRLSPLGYSYSLPEKREQQPAIADPHERLE